MEGTAVGTPGASDRRKEYDLIFPSVVGTPLDHRNLLKTYKEYLSQCGLPYIRFHDQRHTAATLKLQQGVHPKVVQERLGHTDITLTLNTYSHVVQGMHDEAAEKIDELLTLSEVSTGVKDELQYLVGLQYKNGGSPIL